MGKYGLIGYKLGHSFSMGIHEAYYDKIGEQSTYSLVEISESELEPFLKSIGEKGFSGVNVTIPYKKPVMPYLDEIAPEALKIGAVNTIKVSDGKLYGFNTDYYGFEKTLDKYNIDILGKNVYILGTGGASKAVSAVCCDRGADVTFVSRTPSDNVISYDALENRKGGIIVNCTPVGMYPNVDDAPMDTVENFEAVVDLIYNPSKTKLMKKAESFGIKAVNGLYMLVAQAIYSESIWHDMDFELDMVDEIFDKLFGENDVK